MTRAFLTVLVLAAACTRPGPAGLSVYRDPQAWISSIALFEQSRLEGVWYEVAGYPQGGCAPARIVVAQGTAEGAACYLPLRGRQALHPAGPGRISVDGKPWWVLWIDADNRTAVIGTPSGAFAAVLNRDPAIPDDRMAAARRVLAFNGYDLTRLQRR